jgi:hypothetical protein
MYDKLMNCMTKFTAILSIRLTHKQKERILTISKHLRMSPSKYCRAKLFTPDNIKSVELKEKLKRLIFDVE